MRPEHWLYTIPLRLRSLFRWAHADQELDDELRDHLERKTEEYMARDDASRGAAPCASRLGRDRADQREMPRGATGELDSRPDTGHSLRPAHVSEVARLHHCRCSDARARHWRECCNFFSCEWRAAEAAELSAFGRTGGAAPDRAGRRGPCGFRKRAAAFAFDVFHVCGEQPGVSINGSVGDGHLKRHRARRAGTSARSRGERRSASSARRSTGAWKMAYGSGPGATRAASSDAQLRLLATALRWRPRSRWPGHYG